MQLTSARDPWVKELCRILRDIAYEQATRECSGGEWGSRIIRELDKLEDAWNKRIK